MVRITKHEASQLSREARHFLSTTNAARIPGPVTRPLAAVARRRGETDRKRDLERFIATAGVMTRRLRVGGVTVFEFLPPADARPSDGYAINIHGGAFMLGHAQHVYPALMAVEIGLPVYSVEYSLAPRAIFPKALEECVAAVGALAGERRDPFVLLGDSAGGNLALSLVQVLQERGGRLPAALGLSTPWVDLTRTGDSDFSNEGRDPVIRWRGQLDKLARSYVGGADPRDPLVSPIYAEYAATFPPCVIVTGTRDPFLSGCVRLHDALERAGAESTLVIEDGMWHDFIVQPDIPEADGARKRMAAELIPHLDSAAR